MKDKALQKIIKSEIKRQKSVINLIASENYVSKDVMTALGSVLTNKYAEGYSKHRYYGGNKYVDELEDLCKSRALKLFSLSAHNWSVNIQALSGSPANLAVLLALVPRGAAASADGSGEPKKIMGMELSHGGHLTHGHKVSLTGSLWKQVPYGVDKKTETLDYSALKKLAIKEKPALIIAGYTAYPRIVDWKKFREIADASGAFLLCDISHLAGLIAGKAYPSQFSYADVVTTTTHKTLRGPRGALIFSKKEFSQKIDKAVFPGLQGGPHMNQIAAAAAAIFEAGRPEFKKYAKQVIKNAKALAGELARLGWRVISGGADSHLLLVDTFGSYGISGKQASDLLEKNDIIVNKNTIPFDTRSPVDPSGIRLGTPAETTRGKKEKDFIAIARKIDKILRQKK